MTSSDSPQLNAGTYTLRVECPECRQTVEFPVELACRLTVDDEGSSLRPVLRAKKADHKCAAPGGAEPLF